MSILIKGMEMPKDGYKVIYVHSNGSVYQPSNAENIWHKIASAIPVPEHGKLIDADAISLEGGPYEYDEWCKWALERYQDAPTIIPAEEGK